MRVQGSRYESPFEREVREAAESKQQWVSSKPFITTSGVRSAMGKVRSRASCLSRGGRAFALQARSVAIALALGALCVIFYAVSMAKALG